MTTDATTRFETRSLKRDRIHAARARHLFGVAFGGHAKCPVTAYVEDVPGALSGEALAERKAHEKAGLKTLRTAPFGAWASFVGEHGLEACNKSLRWSRMLPPAVYDTSVHGFNMVAPRPAGKLISASGAGGASGQAVYERTEASSPQLNVHTAPTPSASAGSCSSSPRSPSAASPAPAFATASPARRSPPNYALAAWRP